MTNRLAKLLAVVVAFVVSLGAVPSLHGQIGVGTWVKDSTGASPGMTMKVEVCCGPKGRRLTYLIPMKDMAPMTLTVDSPFDGSEAPVLIGGKPSGETMAITWLDSHHVAGVVKMNGKPFGTSKSTLSPDGKTITVENDFSESVGSQTVGKSTEIWVKQ
ncbi:MAG TPA: hypothetical protein VIG08_08125 [Gemmatimonadales bacterium]|jgi:hypothetical protein